MSDLEQTIANLDAWFESVSTPNGYGGPVVHWWQNCLQFTGAGLDWRYEGLIGGYLTLWQRTRETAWLEKATRCGRDLLNGQLPNGHFRHSSFEKNPYGAGTSHEIAADVGLIELAITLHKLRDKRWRHFANAAKKNLFGFYVNRLWDKQAARFHYATTDSTFLLSQSATISTALFLWANLNNDAEPIERYALPTLKAIRQLQVENGRLQGGIPHSVREGKVNETYFPLDIGRIIPAFIHAYEYTEDNEWIDAAEQAFAFITRSMTDDGLLPQAIYPTMTNSYPHWIASLGVVLRAGKLLQSYNAPVDLMRMEQQLFDAQLPTGGMRTACGFGGMLAQRRNRLPDFRDAVSVAGWSDKAFRYFAECLPEKAKIPVPKIKNWQTACKVRGKTAVWHETNREMRLTIRDKVVYRWEKGTPWAAVSSPMLLWK